MNILIADDDAASCLMLQSLLTTWGYLPAGNPDWAASLTLLRILDHDDLYKSPR